MNAHRKHAFLTYSGSPCIYMNTAQRADIIPKYICGHTNLRQLSHDVANTSRGTGLTTELYGSLEWRPNIENSSSYPMLACVCFNCQGMDYWTSGVLLDSLKKERLRTYSNRESFDLSIQATNLNMCRGQQLIPIDKRANMLKLWKRVHWWHNHTPEQLGKYYEYEKTGTFQTPDWHTVASDNGLTSAGKEKAMQYVCSNWPHLGTANGILPDVKSVAVLDLYPIGNVGVVPAFLLGSMAGVAKGDPVLQVNTIRQQCRGYERVPDTTYHQAALPDLVIGHPLSGDTTTGNNVPFLEQDGTCLVRFWDEDMHKLAVQHELSIRP